MWEYKWHYLDMKGVGRASVKDEQKMLGELNELGRDGWEIVGIVPLALGFGTATRIMVWLKRQLKG